MLGQFLIKCSKICMAPYSLCQEGTTRSHCLITRHSFSVESERCFLASVCLLLVCGSPQPIAGLRSVTQLHILYSPGNLQELGRVRPQPSAPGSPPVTILSRRTVWNTQVLCKRKLTELRKKHLHGKTSSFCILGQTLNFLIVQWG